MRVLLVNDHPPGPTGGAEVHVARLREGLAAAGHPVATFVPDRAHGGIARVLDVWDPIARRRLQRRIASFDPDVVHYHNILDELSTSVLGTGKPSVLTVHDPRVLGIRYGIDHGRSALSPVVIGRSAKNRLAAARLRRSVHATIAPSLELADSLRRAGFPRVHHLPNSAPVQPASPPGDEVVFVGTVSEHKGPHLLLDAFTRIASQHPGTTLRVVGDGPMLATLQQRAAGSDGRIRFDGRVGVDEVPDRLREAALVALPSLGVEGGGPTLSVIEAMCSGRAVVVSDRPGVCEGVDETVGRVVPAGNVSALADAMHELLADREQLQRCGAEARRRAVERWSPEIAVQRIAAVYEEAVDDAC